MGWLTRKARGGADVPGDDEVPGGDPTVYAARAQRAYVAMQRRFRMNDGLYRRDGSADRGAPAYLWPFTRALVATLDLTGVSEDLLDAFDADAAIADCLRTLERYWDAGGDPPAHSSDVVGRGRGGDRYYDDNAWVGLALVQLERMRPGGRHLDRARELFQFAVNGWDRRAGVVSSGGVFWVEQGTGAGAANHDRNTVSNAPNAELGLHLAELTGVDRPTAGPIGAEEMYEWVNSTLDASREGDAPATGLYWDKVRGDGTIDQALWSYNQGAMIGANVLLDRRGQAGDGVHLARAEAVARKALRHFDGGGYERQPSAFNAILFRNLLLLYAASADDGLRGEIVAAMRAYADRAWSQRRDRRDCFHSAKGVTLLDQGAMVQVLALLAWDPDAYGNLA